jgi:uncharacterized protein YkwD
MWNWKHLATYSLLSLSSFGFFTGVFHAVAHAQMAQNNQPILPPISPITTTGGELPTQQAQLYTSNKTVPTPTVYVAPITSPKDDQVTITPTSTPETKTKDANKTVAPTAIPTAIPALTNVPIQKTVATSVAPQTNAGGIDPEKLFSMVNAHRQAMGLAALQKDDRVCSLATARTSEIAGEMAAGTLHSGMYARNLPYWNTENAAAYGSEEADLNWWLNDDIHRRAIESATHTYSCVACSGNYCVQEFTSFQAK